jgi:hypothetical protein
MLWIWSRWATSSGAKPIFDVRIDKEGLPHHLSVVVSSNRLSLALPACQPQPHQHNELSFNMQLNLQSRAGAFLMLGSLMIPLASSFNSVQPLAFRSTVSTNKRTSTNVHQHMLPPDALLNAAADPAVWDHFTSQLVAAASAPTSSTDAVTALAFLDGQSTQFLADATVEVADKATWWQSYLAIFKGALNLVHSTIDQPLRSVGIEQTWGVSIAIFTAGT